jgi:hypothetical protein
MSVGRPRSIGSFFTQGVPENLLINQRRRVKGHWCSCWPFNLPKELRNLPLSTKSRQKKTGFDERLLHFHFFVLQNDIGKKIKVGIHHRTEGQLQIVEVDGPQIGILVVLEQKRRAPPAHLSGGKTNGRSNPGSAKGQGELVCENGDEAGIILHDNKINAMKQIEIKKREFMKPPSQVSNGYASTTGREALD